MSKRVANTRPISAEETYPLRHRILRPNQSLEDCAYQLDKAASSYHVGYYLNNELVGIGSVFQEAEDGDTRSNSWRIRGMAVSESLQGKGIGGEILQALIAYTATQGLPGEVWCNGRVSARRFYERAGFAQKGDIFELPPIGPHILLTKSLTERDLNL